jgi:carbon storage regulator CsrA
MLVLSRKSCQSVVVGDPANRLKQSLKVTVLEIHGNKVKLGFEAASDVPVNRWEVWKELRAGIRHENWRAGPAPLFAHFSAKRDADTTC